MEAHSVLQQLLCNNTMALTRQMFANVNCVEHSPLFCCCSAAAMLCLCVLLFWQQSYAKVASSACEKWKSLQNNKVTYTYIRICTNFWGKQLSKYIHAAMLMLCLMQMCVYTRAINHAKRPRCRKCPDGWLCVCVFVLSAAQYFVDNKGRSDSCFCFYCRRTSFFLAKFV